MTEMEHITEEMLNAFIDQELADNDMMHVYLAMSKDPDLRDRVCELRANKELLRAAYRQVPAPRKYQRPPGLLPRTAMAAGIMSLGVGALLGWYAHSFSQSDNPPRTVARAYQTFDSKVKVVFHVSRNDAAAFAQILDEAEALVAAEDDKRSNNSVRIVANGDGLFLLSAKASPFKDRIRILSEKYNNLVFAGCSQTQKRLQRERGLSVDLLPQVSTVNSGVFEVLRLQEAGWKYIPI